MAKTSIGLVAPSSQVPQIELQLGTEKLLEAGFEVEVNPQVKKSARFFAGTDQQRADAFFSMAHKASLDILWAARGGSGAARILPLLTKLTQKKGKPGKKLLVGYSDTTILMEYVRRRWGWSILHAPMPSMRTFSIYPRKPFQNLVSLLHGGAFQGSFPTLRRIGKTPRAAIEAPMVGGNLAVWVSAIGTSYLPPVSGRILFLEEVSEPVYRIDRMVVQAVQSGAFRGVKAIVLGTFSDCKDPVQSVLAKKPNLEDLKTFKHRKLAQKPLRKANTPQKAILETFHEVGERLKVPVFYGLPVGHGEKGLFPLPLGATYRLTPQGRLSLLRWAW